MSSLFSELECRNVFRLALAYLLVTWLIIQISDVVIPLLGIPAFEVRDPGLTLVKIDAWLAPLRVDRRFEELLKK